MRTRIICTQAVERLQQYRISDVARSGSLVGWYQFACNASPVR
jgi:hypothetical protein